MERRLLRTQSSISLATTDTQIASPNGKRYAIVLSCTAPPVSAQATKTVLGSALSGATTGAKLVYTVSAGVQGYLTSVSWVSTAGTPPTIALQLVRGATTYQLIANLAQGVTAVNMALLAGDKIQLNVTTLGAGNTFDATISATEDQLPGRVTVSYTGPATLDQGVNLYPGDPPFILLYDHIGQAIREDIHAVAASGTPTITVIDVFEEGCDCLDPAYGSAAKPQPFPQSR